MYAVDQTGRLTDDALDPLVVRARDGDLEAFEALVRRMQGPVRSYARRVMRDDYLGDDAAQEAMVRIWRGLPAYRPTGSFVAWSYTVTRNACVELLRKQSRAPIPQELPERGEDITDALDLKRAVRAAVDGLDEPFRSVFVLRETGLSYEEVAESLDCPVGTVRSRLHEARRRLGETLAPFVSEESS